MTFSPLARWLLVALAVVSLPACNRSNTSDKPRVGFVSNNAASFWTIAEAGSRAAEKKFDVEVIFRKPASGDQAVQKEVIDNVLSQGVKAMAVSVIDPKGQRIYLNEIAAKVPLLTQDNDAPDSNRLAYIGTNNYLAGRAVGKLVKEALPDGGKIAIFVGQLEPLNARQRQRGVVDELANAPEPANINDIERGKDGVAYGKYFLQGTYTDQPVGEQKAKENADDVLTQLQDEKNVCLIGLWAYNPPAILSAVKDKKKTGQVKIVGFDEDFATLQGIADGHIYATVVQNPYQFGFEAVRLMASLAKGDNSVLPPKGIMYVPHRVITKEAGKDRLAVGPFRTELEMLLGKK